MLDGISDTRRGVNLLWPVQVADVPRLFFSPKSSESAWMIDCALGSTTCPRPGFIQCLTYFRTQRSPRLHWGFQHGHVISLPSASDATLI